MARAPMMRNRRITKRRGLTRRAIGLCAIPASLVLNACASDPKPVSATELNALVDRDVDRIVADIGGLRPSDRVEQVRLIGPDGQVFRPERRGSARGVEATQSQPTVGVQARGGSASGIEPGLTLSLDLFDWSWGGSETVRKRRVTVVFPIPESYGALGQDWRVEATIRDAAGGTRVRRATIAPE